MEDKTKILRSADRTKKAANETSEESAKKETPKETATPASGIFYHFVFLMPFMCILESKFSFITACYLQMNTEEIICQSFKK